jgi:FMN phosphatase YigB (HAD superfamily)
LGSRGRNPSQVLSVGDTTAADVEGPRKFGMPAMLTIEFPDLYRLLPSLG